MSHGIYGKRYSRCCALATALGSRLYSAPDSARVGDWGRGVGGVPPPGSSRHPIRMRREWTETQLPSPCAGIAQGVLSLSREVPMVPAVLVA